jgi:hypothetical protein
MTPQTITLDGASRPALGTAVFDLYAIAPEVLGRGAVAFSITHPDGSREDHALMLGDRFAVGDVGIFEVAELAPNRAYLPGQSGTRMVVKIEHVADFPSASHLAAVV